MIRRAARRSAADAEAAEFGRTDLIALHVAIMSSPVILHVSGYDSCPWFQRAKKLVGAALDSHPPSVLEADHTEGLSRDEYHAFLKKKLPTLVVGSSPVAGVVRWPQTHTTSPLVTQTPAGGGAEVYVGGSPELEVLLRKLADGEPAVAAPAPSGFQTTRQAEEQDIQRFWEERARVRAAGDAAVAGSPLREAPVLGVLQQQAHQDRTWREHDMR